MFGMRPFPDDADQAQNDKNGHQEVEQPRGQTQYEGNGCNGDTEGQIDSRAVPKLLASGVLSPSVCEAELLVQLCANSARPLPEKKRDPEHDQGIE